MDIADSATVARVEAIARQAGATAAAHKRAAEIDRGVRAAARDMGVDPTGYVVLVAGSPEHVRAERSLMRARAL